MEPVFVNIQVSNEEGRGDRVNVEVMVDTDFAHTLLPRALLDSLQVWPVSFEEVEYRDGPKELIQRGQIRIRIVGFEPTWTCPVYFGSTERYLLGATTLAIFGLMVDPEQGGLVKRPPIKARPF